MKLVLLLLTVIVIGCSLKVQDSARFNLDTWSLVKTHQVDKTEPLYAGFGPVTYDVYVNPILSGSRNKSEAPPINSEIAIRVYSGPRDMQHIALTGFISKSGVSPDGRWKITAYDSNKIPLSEEQVAAKCYVCHSAAGDNIILGTY